MRLYQGSKVSKRAAEDLEKMQSVYAKESTTLTNNLGSDLLRQSHVMLNHENLRMLAILHESLVSVYHCLVTIKYCVLLSCSMYVSKQVCL